jgi:two-component system, NarL family, response regulator LiaR
LAEAVTRVVVLSPVLLYREAWRALLSVQPGITVAGVTSVVEDMSNLASPSSPTTVLSDLPAQSSEAVHLIKNTVPGAGVLCLVHSYDLTEIISLLQAGANGCLTRDEPVADLARAVIATGRGEIALPPEIAGRTLAAMAHGAPLVQDQVEPLSEREVEVLRLLAQGLTNKDIAQTLIVSVRTIEAHLRSIFGKLGVRSRTEAVLWAVRHGYSSAD